MANDLRQYEFKPLWKPRLLYYDLITTLLNPCNVLFIRIGKSAKSAGQITIKSTGLIN
jgi:hypothetical protein